MIEIPEIKGCPHCGGKIRVYVRINDIGNIYLNLVCSTCDFGTRKYMWQEELYAFLSHIKKSIETWNTRMGGEK